MAEDEGILGGVVSKKASLTQNVIVGLSMIIVGIFSGGAFDPNGIRAELSQMNTKMDLVVQDINEIKVAVPATDRGHDIRIEVNSDRIDENKNNIKENTKKLYALVRHTD